MAEPATLTDGPFTEVSDPPAAAENGSAPTPPEAPAPEATTVEQPPAEGGDAPKTEPEPEAEFIPVQIDRVLGIEPGVGDEAWKAIESAPGWPERQAAIRRQLSNELGNVKQDIDSTFQSTANLFNQVYDLAQKGDQTAEQMARALMPATGAFVTVFRELLSSGLSEEERASEDYKPYARFLQNPNQTQLPALVKARLEYERELGRKEGAAETAKNLRRKWDRERQLEAVKQTLHKEGANTPPDVGGKGPAAASPKDEEILKGEPNTPAWFAAYERQTGLRAPLDTRP